MLAIRIDASTDAELGRLVKRLPCATKSGLARILIERALAELGGDPSKLLSTPPDGDIAMTESPAADGE